VIEFLPTKHEPLSLILRTYTQRRRRRRKERKERRRGREGRRETER
jgi:hypothetical protein